MKKIELTFTNKEKAKEYFSSFDYEIFEETEKNITINIFYDNPLDLYYMGYGWANYLKG